MQTVAVICDDIVECYNNQDERCESVTTWMNTLQIRRMTAGSETLMDVKSPATQLVLIVLPVNMRTSSTATQQGSVSITATYVTVTPTPSVGVTTSSWRIVTQPTTRGGL